MMTGFDLDLFVDPVSEELICCICHDVKRAPAEFISCQHSYCRECITTSMNINSQCPRCRANRSASDLRDCRIIRNLIDELKMRCKYHENGCERIVKVEFIEAHQTGCEFNFHPCPKECGAKITPAMGGSHKCVRWLAAENERLIKRLKAQDERIEKLETAGEEQTSKLETILSQVQTAVVSLQTVHNKQQNQSGRPAVVSLTRVKTEPAGLASRSTIVGLPAGQRSAVTTEKILVAGGMNVANGGKKKSMRSVHLFDPTTTYWTQMAPMIRARSQHMAAVLPDSQVRSGPGARSGPAGKVIIQMGGFDFNSSLATVETSALNVTQSGINLTGWLEDMPDMFVGRSAAGCTVMDGKIYVYGGLHSKNEYLSSMESFSPEINLWSREQKMIEKRASFGAAHLEGSLYAVGGVHTEAPGSFFVTGPSYNYQRRSFSAGEQILSWSERYSTRQRRWVSIEPMQVPRKSLALVAVPKSVHGGSGALYAIGGFHAHTRSEVECYNPATDSWSMKKPLPVGVMDASAVRVDRFIYIFGGFDGTEITDRVWRYDTKLDSWTEVAPLPERKSFSTAVVI